jgi:hypothetical protein
MCESDFVGPEYFESFLKDIFSVAPELAYDGFDKYIGMFDDHKNLRQILYKISYTDYANNQRVSKAIFDNFDKYSPSLRINQINDLLRKATEKSVDDAVVFLNDR